MEKNFKITWFQKGEKIPLIDTNCPKCSDGMIYKSKFFEGVYCNSCKWSWRPSKFEAKGEKPKEPKWGDKVLEMEMLERIDRNVQYMTDKVKEKYGDK